MGRRVLSEKEACEKITNHRSAWAIIYRCAGDAATASDGQKRGKHVRERLIAEYQNSALINALILTLVATATMNPSQDITQVDQNDPRFRVYMYSCSVSAGACTLGLSTSLTLLYQLNMLLDEDVDDFILFLAKFKCSMFISPTGLPDILVILSGLAFLSMIAGLCAVVHILCVPVDAWIITGIFIFVVYLPFQIITCKMDAWKWRMLKKKDASKDVRMRLGASTRHAQEGGRRRAGGRVGRVGSGSAGACPQGLDC